LPIADGHLELPDLRIEIRDGGLPVDYRDVELVTERYWRGQLAGKRVAGFALYRAAWGRAATRLGVRTKRNASQDCDLDHVLRRSGRLAALRRTRKYWCPVWYGKC